MFGEMAVEASRTNRRMNECGSSCRTVAVGITVCGAVDIRSVHVERGTVKLLGRCCCAEMLLCNRVCSAL